MPDLHGSVAGSLAAAATALTGAIRYDGYGQTVDSDQLGSTGSGYFRYQGRLAFDNAPARAALVDAPSGRTNQPFVLGGEILVAVPIERHTEVPTGQVLDRIRVGAFEAWIGERMAGLEVIVDDNPFGVPEAPGSPSPVATAPEAIPTVEPMATPPQIVVPGASVP